MKLFKANVPYQYIMYRTTSNMNEENKPFEIIPKKIHKKQKKTIDIEWTVPIPSSITSKKRKFKIIEKEKKKLTCALKNNRNENELIKLLENIKDDSNSEITSVVSDLTIDSSLEKINNTIEENVEEENIVKPKPKLKRNELCFCGSGNKYKKCCLNNNCYEFDDFETINSSLSIQPDHPVKFTERQSVIYPLETDDTINNPDEETILLQVQSFNANYRIKLKPQKMAHINQIETATKICETFSNKQKVIQLVISRTQTGKTGCMLEFINQYINRYQIPINHIYIIANISSNDWIKQTKDRAPQDLEGRIFHLPNLNKEFRQAVEGKKNILIIVDEAHCASLKQQTLSKLLSKEGMDWNLDKMLENDIKIVQFSATPDGLIFGYKKKEWPKQHYEVHIMKEGQGYYGISQMKERRDKTVLKQAKDLSGKDKYGAWRTETSENEVNQNLSELFDDILSFVEPKYSIIRCHGLTFDYIKDNITNYLSNLPTLIGNKFNNEFRTYTEDGDISQGQLDDLLKIKPEKHTIILIKEKLKCSNTLCKTHLGVVYERCTAKDINDSFIIQGLLGRITGYGRHDIICYTNLESIDKYENLFKNNFDEKTLNEVQWNSNSTKVTTKGTKGRVTYIDPRQVLTENTSCKVHGIPIRIDFKTEENHSKLFEKLKDINKSRKSKEDYKTIHTTILQFVNEGLIDLSTHEKSVLYSKNQQEMINNIYKFFLKRTLKACRIYKNGDIAKSRRYKSWQKAYQTGNADSAQSGDSHEYSIDMCKDNWFHDGAVNPKTIAWISYKE